MTARVRHRCAVCDRPLNGRRGRPCIRNCGVLLCRRPHRPECRDVHGGQCDRLNLPEEDYDMNSQDEPDGISAADARAVLAELGVDTFLGVGADGKPTVRTDRAGLETLRDQASAFGASAIAAALDIALAERLDEGEAS